MRKIDLTNFQVGDERDGAADQPPHRPQFHPTPQPMSRADLARRSGLQRSTVSAIVDQLIDEGWVTEGAVRPCAARPPPRFLHLNVERAGILAVELRPEITTVGLAASTPGSSSRRRGRRRTRRRRSSGGWRARLPRCVAHTRASSAKALASACRAGSARRPLGVRAKPALGRCESRDDDRIGRRSAGRARERRQRLRAWPNSGSAGTPRTSGTFLR